MGAPAPLAAAKSASLQRRKIELVPLRGPAGILQKRVPYSPSGESRSRYRRRAGALARPATRPSPTGRATRLRQSLEPRRADTPSIFQILRDWWDATDRSVPDGSSIGTSVIPIPGWSAPALANESASLNEATGGKFLPRHRPRRLPGREPARNRSACRTCPPDLFPRVASGAARACSAASRSPSTAKRSNSKGCSSAATSTLTCRSSWRRWVRRWSAWQASSPTASPPTGARPSRSPRCASGPPRVRARPAATRPA